MRFTVLTAKALYWRDWRNLTTRLTGHKRMTRKGDFNFLTALTYEPHY